ncbi:MAG: hypothetical protein AB1798_03465 [Spirochaetota bacterium]
MQQGGYGETFESVLPKWGAANLLSDATAVPAGYQYNRGGYFTSRMGDMDYNLGSINLYNYTYITQAGPYIYTSSPVGLLNQYKTSNLYYLAGTGLSGQHAWNITLPAGVKMTVVLK